MDFLDMALRTLLGAPLFLYLPGALLDRRWFGLTYLLSGVERIAGRVFVSVLVTAWLALLLAEVGWFSFWSLLAATLAVCGATMFLRPPTSYAVYELAPWWRRFDVILVIIAAVFALVVARPFEVVRGGLDAGVYANTAASIARTGGIVVHDPVAEEIGARVASGDTNAQQIATNMLGVQNSQRFAMTRIRAAGFFMSADDLTYGRVVPQFFHLWPTFIAVWVSMLGPVYGLAATGIAGTLGVVFAGLIGRRIAGATAGLLAAAFMATMTPQVWFSRMPTSEAFTQALLLGGCWAYIHFVDAIAPRQRIWWGALVGLAFGQLALTRIDFPLALAPIVLLLLYIAVSRRWHRGYTAMATVGGMLLAHSALHIIFIARGYFIDTTIPTLQKYALTITLAWPLLTPELQVYSAGRQPVMIGNWGRLALEVGALVLVVAGAFVLRRQTVFVRATEARLRRWRRLLLALLVLGLGVLATYAYLVRPGIITRDVLRAPFTPANWLQLQGYVGAPIAIPFDDFPRKPVVAVAQANMARLGWYLSPLGVVLGVVGGLLLWWRVDRRTWLLLVIGTVYAFFFIQSLYGTQDQTYIYILRRYVPIVFPAFVIAMAYVLRPPTTDHRRAQSAERGTTWGYGSLRIIARPTPWLRWSVVGRRWSTIGRWSLAAALLLFFVVTGRTVYAHTEYAGMLAQIETLSAAVGPDDIVLLRGGGAGEIAVRDTSELVAAPLTYVYGRNAFPVKGRTPGKYPEAFADQVARWRGEGRRVLMLLGASGGDMLLPGFVPRALDMWTLRLVEFQQLTNQKPKLSYVNEVPFRLYELVADDQATWPAQLDPDDTAAQVAGFYRSETPVAGQARASWTDGGGILRLPTTLAGRTISLNLASGERPRAAGTARVCPAVVAEPRVYPEGGAGAVEGWNELGCYDVGKATTLTLPVPQLASDGTLLLRLRSEAWVPADTEPDPGMPQSADRRPLGVQFVGIR